MRFVALILSGICALTFGLQKIFGTELFSLDKSLLFQHPWTLVTSIFAHANIVHLLSNIFALALFGLILEARIGPKRVLTLFFASGLIVNLLSPYPRSLGASGAIFGIIGTLTYLRPKFIVWVTGMPVPMVIAALIWLFQDIMGVLVPSSVGNIAHIIGLVFGLGMGIYWRKYRDKIFSGKKRDPKIEKEIDEWQEKHMP